MKTILTGTLACLLFTGCKEHKDQSRFLVAPHTTIEIKMETIKGEYLGSMVLTNVSEEIGVVKVLGTQVAFRKVKKL